MNVRINIKTPTGKSLEGFPVNITPKSGLVIDVSSALVYLSYQDLYNPALNKGDIITIEVL